MKTKTSEKLERAKWLFKEYAGRLELFERGEERIMYDPEKDIVISYANGKTAFTPNKEEGERLLEK